MKKGAWKRVARAVAQYATSVAAVVFGVAAVTMSLLGDTTSQLTWVLAILTFMSATMLVEHLLKVDAIMRDVREVRERVEDSCMFLHCSPDGLWDDALATRGRMFASGGSLSFLGARPGDLELLLEDGCIIDAVLVRPGSEALSMLHENAVREPASVEEFDLKVRSTAGLLLACMRRYPGQVNVRLDDRVPAFGMLTAYAGERPERIQVNLFSGKVAYDKRLSFVVRDKPGRSQMAYDYFWDQIVQLKARLSPCTPEELEAIAAIGSGSGAGARAGQAAGDD